MCFKLVPGVHLIVYPPLLLSRPENIVLTSEGHAKITDFGAVRSFFLHCSLETCFSCHVNPLTHLFCGWHLPYLMLANCLHDFSFLFFRAGTSRFKASHRVHRQQQKRGMQCTFCRFVSNPLPHLPAKLHSARLKACCYVGTPSLSMPCCVCTLLAVVPNGPG